MSRSSTTEVVILRNGRIGEIHKNVWMLSPDLGLISAIAHGAYSQKGKLRGVTNPFSFGRCYLYTDPVKKSVKITDLAVHEFFPGLREDVAKFYTASLWAELVLRTFGGGGESGTLFSLLVESLHALDATTGFEPVTVQFLWRYLGVSGLQPDLDECAVCGAPLSAGRAWDASHGGFLCPACAQTADRAELTAGAAAYLRHSGTLSLSDSLHIRLEAAALSNAKRVLYRIVQDVAETPLNSLRIGGGIL
ncbi:MAG: DNA repair protein RecO [Spirochaetaceae bacterium]|nr:MAG: DNA repair protein RecO [Spirochaetaceae bacterium]